MSDTTEDLIEQLTPGTRIRVPGEHRLSVLESFRRTAAGGTLLVSDGDDAESARRMLLTADQVSQVVPVLPDGAASPRVALAGLWCEWMLHSIRTARSTALSSSALKPLPHQMEAVYEHMLPQPMLRFLLADEPGTGKTIMAGMWLREMQRLGKVDRALVVCPAHLVTKWQADFDKFFGGGLRAITLETIQQDALNLSPDKTWVVSLHLAASNPAVRQALRVKKAGWDAVIFDEAHRMTPQAETFHLVGSELSAAAPHALLLTATPHRGEEWLFRELLHLVDPDIFPSVSSSAQGLSLLRPGRLHFLRRMKEELLDYDGTSRLFREREAQNVPVPLNSTEQHFYDEALRIATTYFPPRGRSLAAMVYGKRAASSLYALAETLRRRRDKMTPGAPAADEAGDPEDEEDLEERVVMSGSVDARAERKAIIGLLAELDPMLTTDGQLTFEALPMSKWDDVSKCLRQHDVTADSRNQAVVFTEFADTADWLVGVFKASGYSARRYSGREDHKERSAIQAAFMAGEFQVIVSTDAGNEGIDLQAAQVLINWDIPWSLVRLEQRMGRIHRIGQHRKAWFYNVIALGTREGDAHQRLMDRLMEAANELGGKMFDCLDAVMERVRQQGANAAHVAMRLLYEHSDFDGDLGLPTVEQLRAARDAHYEELKTLRSEVNRDIALRARNDERKTRVNPVVVEQFLRHAKEGGLADFKPVPLADRKGFFYLTVDQPQHGWELPPELHDGNGRGVLVALDGELRQTLIERGNQRAGESVMFGPSDPPMEAFVTCLRQRVSADMWQGALLMDPSANEDYTLFVYECDITEGENIPESRHRPHTTTVSWLIAVDGNGRAWCESWDALPNLVAGGDIEPTPLDSTIEETAETRAREAADTDMQQRSEKLDGWFKDVDSQLRDLPKILTKHIEDSAQRHQQTAALRANLATRREAARSAAKVSRGNPRRIGWAQVVASQDAQDADASDSETVSMKVVTDLLTAQGWTVHDVHTELCGYDLHAVRGAEQRFVEVKGRRGQASSVGIVLTMGEIVQAAQLQDDYWLYVVDNCADGIGRLFGACANPIKAIGDDLIPNDQWRVPGSKLKHALSQQGDR